MFVNNVSLMKVLYPLWVGYNIHVCVEVNTCMLPSKNCKCNVTVVVVAYFTSTRKYYICTKLHSY